ncbi:lipopolysaccharide biosynthesis protein [Enterococcus gallinarum]|uniref:lipopolysaccharide biosynthesis protein n=1 Tax=Enterococcus gallinarum TaxID=1353 RepID=UPI0004973FE0|nr:lipopolysaccharide biosynthesis protein [Enterococcus gallinarum]
MRNAFKSGMIFTAIGQYSNVLIQLLINVILSRLIPVEEFGVVANVQVFLVFFQMFVTAGLGPAIIQNKKMNENDYGIVFNYTVLFAVLLALGFGFFGSVVAIIYGNPIYKPLFWFMSIIVLSEGMNVVPTAILNKELRFRALNLRLLFCNLFGAIVGIVAAFAGLGVYALILSTAVPAMATLFTNFAIVKIRYTKSMDFKPVKTLWTFARNQLGFTILNYFSRNSDNLLIGKFLGPTSLANYQKSYQMITMPNTVFLGIISPVLQPVLSHHQEDVKLIRETFLKIIHVLGLIAFPLTVFMVINSKEIILFLFGTRWHDAILPFSILAFSIWAQMLTSATGSIFMARNHSKTLLKTGILSTFLILGFTLVGVTFSSIIYVALFVCIAYILNFFTSYWILMNKVLDGTLFDVLKELITPIVISGILSIVLVLFNTFVVLNVNLFLLLLIRGVLWAISLFGSFVITGEYKKIKSIF